MSKNLLSHNCARLARSTFARLSILLIVVLLSQESFGQARLVQDIAYMEDLWAEEYSYLIDADGTLYFVANHQLWRSDGTVEGTAMVKGFSYFESPLWVDGTLYFVADDGLTGRELWKSDGTTQGTALVRDVRPGTAGSFPGHLSSLGNTIFFTANDGIHGIEVWKTDGSESGTVLVRDIMRVAGSSNPTGLTALGAWMFFSANDGRNGYELWKTDGTSAGTTLVKDIWAGGSSAPNSFTRNDDRLFFVARDGEGKELWVTDGTGGGTRMVRAIRPGSGSPGIGNMTAVNNTLFFTANDGVHGAEIWKSNGTAEGTMLVKDMTPGPAGSHGEGPFQHLMGNFRNVNGTLFYTAYQRFEYYIWKSDGTPEGTIPLHRAAGPGISQPKPNFTYMNGSIYYFDQTDEQYSEDYYLYRMNEDGSSPEIVKQLSIYDNYNPYYPLIVKVNDHLYFTGQTNGGMTLIKSDGTPGGTDDFIDVYDGTVSSDPDNFVRFNGRVYFDVRSLDDEFYYHDFPGGLWRSDGTADGTTDVLEDFHMTMSAVTDEALYVAGGEWGTPSVWKIDRQDNVTRMVELDHGNTVIDLVVAGSVLYFSSSSGELWRSDGTSDGTFRLIDAYAIRSITPMANGLMAQVVSENGDEELWRSYGSPWTTEKVKTIRSGWGTMSRRYPTAVVDGILFFVANDGVHGNELWRSNGTTTGTYMAVDVNGNDRVESGNVEYDFAAMTVFQDELYFSALQIVDGVDTWSLRSYRDGEMSTSYLETDHAATELIPDWGHLFLVFERNADTHELWSYYPGRPMQRLAALDGKYRDGFDYEMSNGVLYYSTQNGPGLWRSDGTPCGTFALDLGSTGAHEMALLGNTLIFASMQPEYGRELYSFDLALDPGNPCEPGTTECTASGTITWEYWEGVQGTRVSDIPLSEPPSETSTLTMFEGPSNIGMHYGSRIRGYICPPVSGDYRFYIASNDHSELWLSDGDDPISKVRIADVPRATGSREWDKFSSQRSVMIPLLKGKRYYIEAVHKQGIGTDHVAVAWTLPDGTFEAPIDGRHLSPFPTEEDRSATSVARGSIEDLFVYPNPVISGYPSLTLSGFERMAESVETDLRITSMTGDVVFSERIRCGGDCHIYPLPIDKKLVPGIYVVSLSAGRRQSTRLLVVK